MLQIIRSTIFACFLATVVLGNVLATADITTEYVPGIFKQNLTSQSPIFYNTYASMLLEYKIPKFDVQALTISPLFSHFDFCKKSMFSSKCPPTFFLQQLISGTFSGNFTPGSALPTPSPVGTLHHTMDSPNFCNEITSHFTDFKASAHLLETYRSKLVECSTGTIASIFRNLQDYNYDLKTFYSNFSASLERVNYDQTDAQTDDVVALNAHTAVQGIFLANVLMESQRWTDAMSACRAGLIPSTLVTTKKLNSALISMESSAARLDYKLSIPANILAQYYKQPLTDCVLSDGGSLLVRILVPVVEKTAKYEHIHVDALPFLKSENEVCLVTKESDKTVVFEHTSGQILDASHVHCRANQLCQLPQYASDWPFTGSDCLAHFLNGHRSDVTAQCHLDCFPYMISDTPIFRTVNGSTVVIAGRLTTNNTISVQCGSKPEQPLNINSYYPSNSSTGALRIHLPCNCKLSYNLKTVFRSESTHCGNHYGNSLTVTYILPYAWQQQHQQQNNTDTEHTAPSTDETNIIDEYDDVYMYGQYYEYMAEYQENTAASVLPNDTDSAIPEDAHPGIANANCDPQTPGGVDAGLNGLLYMLCVMVGIIVATLCLICFKLVQIEKWRRHHESEGDKHPIMTYHVFNDQQDVLARSY